VGVGKREILYDSTNERFRLPTLHSVSRFFHRKSPGERVTQPRGKSISLCAARLSGTAAAAFTNVGDAVCPLRFIRGGVNARARRRRRRRITDRRRRLDDNLSGVTRIHRGRETRKRVSIIPNLIIAEGVTVNRLEVRLVVNHNDAATTDIRFTGARASGSGD